MEGILSLSSYLSRTTIGSGDLATRQFGESSYYWNETIVEGTSADTGVTEQWFSYSVHPGLENDGVREYSRHLKEIDDAIVEDEQAWSTIIVPTTSPLPYVEGEPAV